MKPLQTIGMKKGWIYEVIVSTYRGNKPHSAPIGVWTDDFVTLKMEIYSDERHSEEYHGAERFRREPDRRCDRFL